MTVVELLTYISIELPASQGSSRIARVELCRDRVRVRLLKYILRLLRSYILGIGVLQNAQNAQVDLNPTYSLFRCQSN